MKTLKHFMLPEHTNQLYKKEAISSISLTRDIADKINELVDAYNEVSEWNFAKHQEQDGTIRKVVLYMKDNLLNSLNDLMDLLLANGFVDERISYHCKVINERLENLLGMVKEGSTSGDAELIDGRMDFTGKVWDNIGEHIRAFFELLGSPEVITREQLNDTYNNLNSKDLFFAGDRVYIEPISINTDTSNINYIAVLGMYGDYAEDGFDTLARILPESVKPVILTLKRDYAGIRITYNLHNSANTIAYGIIKKLHHDLSSLVYENRVKLYNQRSNYHLFEPSKMRYGAHQGYRAVAPANSLPAYEEMGKAGFEWAWIAGCRQSAEGTWFVMHDATVDGTTDGTGAIKEMTDAEIAALALDTGNNVNKYTREELKVPTVEEVIKICNKYGVNICFRLASLYTNTSGIAHFRSLIDLVKKNGQENAIFSGNVKQMEMLKTFTDNWHGQVYVDTASEQDVIDMIDTYVANGWTNMSILATYAATTKNAVEYCHSKGYKYCVSDIPTDEDSDIIVSHLQSLGVDICQSGHIYDKYSLRQLWTKVEG